MSLTKILSGIRLHGLVLTIAFAFSAAFLLLYFIIPRQEAWVNDQLTRSSERSLRQLSESILSPLLTRQYAELYESIDAQLQQHPNWKRIRVVSAKGLQVYPLETWREQLEPGDVMVRQDIKVVDTVVASIDLDANFGVEIREGKRFHLLLGALQLLLLTVLFVILYWLVERNVTTPLRGLISSFRQVANGKFDTELPRQPHNEVGEVIEAFADMRTDISNQQGRLEQLRKNSEEASRAKSRFLSSMSHELRTPLNAIQGFSELNLYDEGASDEQKARARSIQRAGKHLLSLIDDMLDLGAIESGNTRLNLSTVNIYAVAQECLQLMAGGAKERNLTLNIDLEAIEGKTAETDRKRVKQVLLNLLSNAVKYNRNGGSIHMRASITDNGSFRISVADTGSGLSSEQMAKLFTPFERLGAELGSKQGTGIGLVITRELLELMEGNITVESALNEGTTFTVDLPPQHSKFVAQQSPVTANGEVELKHVFDMSPDNERASAGGSKRILVAEDSKVNQQLLRLQLKALGYRATFANDGEEALQMLEEQAYDILLTDIKMPKMDGVQLTRKIRANERDGRKKLYILAITANVMGSDIKSYLHNGIDDCIPKPVQLDRLRASLGMCNEVVR